jgi:2-polyprenyl-3-methyl-5-hydroxy-6-metoxy-1,4-benzoquinol methylase
LETIDLYFYKFSKVLEHVDNQTHFIKSCLQCLQSNGSLFVSTINRTKKSLVGAIFLAEYAAGIVPVGEGFSFF